MIRRPPARQSLRWQPASRTTPFPVTHWTVPSMDQCLTEDTSALTGLGQVTRRDVITIANHVGRNRANLN